MAKTAAEPRHAPLSIVRHPIYAMLLPVPIVCFIGGLLTDISYSASDGNLTWLNFSSWLIAAGLVFGGIAAVVLLIDVVRGVGRRRVGWAQVGLLAVAW